MWCRIHDNNTCFSASVVSEGSSCGEDGNHVYLNYIFYLASYSHNLNHNFFKWCINGECVPMNGTNEAKIIDGGWGEWGNWSECTHSCDSGIQFRRRKCDNPKSDILTR